MKPVIVSCATNVHYRRGLNTLRELACRHVPEADLMLFTDLPPGCPHHREEMYAFKIHALAKAVEARYRRIVWMDTWFAPIGSFGPLWERLDAEGWYVAPQLDARLGEWCSDTALTKFGIDRSQAWEIPLVYSGLVALDVDRWPGIDIWILWKAMQRNGSFNGPHKNLPGKPVTEWGQKWQGHCSHDVGVSGHRHDEAALSYVLASLGLTPPKLGFLTLENPAGFIGHHMEKVQ